MFSIELVWNVPDTILNPLLYIVSMSCKLDNFANEYPTYAYSILDIMNDWNTFINDNLYVPPKGDNQDPIQTLVQNNTQVAERCYIFKTIIIKQVIQR